ncbi:hypothetical protein DDSR119_32 [Pseudomonas phage DDSR119]|nr:hypothetical protein DDSR119_32 [Pseudomonas phage DDSR119]
MSLNFWDLGEGQKALEAGKTSIEVEGGGNLDMPIPAGTQVRIIIADAKWETSDGAGTYINLKYQVEAPACYKGRIIFHKLHVRCHEFPAARENARLTEEKLANKRVKALRMFAVIDANAGGKLLASGKMPDDVALQTNLSGKTMAMTLDVYEFDTDKDGKKLPNRIDWNRGNWVKKVDPRTAFVDMTKEQQEAAVEASKREFEKMLNDAGGVRNTPAASGPAGGGGGMPGRPAGGAPAADFDSFDDDIPF